MSVAILILVASCSDSSKKSESESQETSKSSKEITSAEKSQDESSVEKKADGEKIVVIDFFATWCPPCKELAPYFEKWANTYKNEVDFQKVDIDKDQMMADENNIEAVPTVIIFTPEGDEISRFVGFEPAEIESRIKDAIEMNR